MIVLCTGTGLVKAQSVVPVSAASPVFDTLICSRDKIHLHTDRDVYLGGETIWFKAYVMNGSMPALAATNLHVNLLSGEGSIIQSKSFPLAGATGDGSFLLPDSLPSEQLWLAAVTTRAGDSNAVYYKRITIVSKTTGATIDVARYHLQLLPEGGTFITGVPNRVAFKADRIDGLPFGFTGLLKNSAGATIDTLSATHNGMGEFVLTPEAGEKYYVEWTDPGNELHQTVLPVSGNGITLHTEQVNQFLYYVIQNPAPDNNLREIRVTASQDDEQVYAAVLDMTSVPTFSGKIPLKQLHAGIVRLTAAGKDGGPLAERISFVQQDYTFHATVNVTEKSPGKRGRNTVEIEVPDSLSASLSVSVMDASFGTAPSASIYSDLLLTDEIRGYVHEPAWYFQSPANNRRKALDLVMLTNGWRKYIAPSAVVNDNYITLSGTVRDNRKNLRAGQSITFMLSGADSSKQFYNVVTDASGSFSKSGLLFYDSAMLRYQLNRKSGDPDMVLQLDRAGPPVPSFILGRPPMVPYPAITAATLKAEMPELFVPQKISDGFTQKGYRLNDVSVKSRKWRNEPMLLMDEKYTTGIFRANATAYAFDVMNDPMKTAKRDIMNYLFGKVPGLSLGYPRGAAPGGFKQLLYSNSPVTYIFIDEHRFEFDLADPSAYSQIQSLDLDEIAYVKFFTRYPLQPDKPALAIYLKKGDEPDANRASVLPKLKVGGYASVKEFYSPDYSIAENQKAVLDKRTTLYWQPYLYTDKEHRKLSFSFYNNDISSGLLLVLEGMNEMGKLVRIEKRID